MTMHGPCGPITGRQPIDQEDRRLRPVKDCALRIKSTLATHGSGDAGTYGTYRPHVPERSVRSSDTVLKMSHQRPGRPDAGHSSAAAEAASDFETPPPFQRYRSMRRHSVDVITEFAGLSPDASTFFSHIAHRRQLHSETHNTHVVVPHRCLTQLQPRCLPPVAAVDGQGSAQRDHTAHSGGRSVNARKPCCGRSASMPRRHLGSLSSDETAGHRPLPSKDSADDSQNQSTESLATATSSAITAVVDGESNVYAFPKGAAVAAAAAAAFAAPGATTPPRRKVSLFSCFGA